jgi:NAD-reducing hydrogenase small subunit
MSLLDLDERLLDLAERVEILASPLTDLKHFPETDITLVEGAVALDEHVETIRRVRERTKVLVSFGDCAVHGNVTALRNMYGIDEVLDRAYRDTATTVIGIPGGNAAVPRLLPRVLPVHEYVKVDHYLQGCPPSADAIHAFLVALLDGQVASLGARRFG